MGVGNVVSISPIVDSDDGRIQGRGFAGQTTLNTAVTIVPAVSGQRIWIHGLFWSGNASQGCSIVEITTGGATVTVQTGSGSNSMSLLANAAMVLPYQQFPWFTAAAGNAIGFSSGGTIYCSGRALYVQG